MTDLFRKANSVNVNKFTEKKNGMTYLTWSKAWAEFVKIYKTATYEIKKNEDGLPHFGNSENGYMVYTTVTAEETTHEMWLPVMDYRNKSIMKPTTFDINKAVMRCLTKNLAMFGLGLYIYAGEDLPEEVAPDEDYRLKENLRKQLEAEINRTGSDRDKLKAFFKVEHIYQLSEKQQAQAMQMLSKKTAKPKNIRDEILSATTYNQLGDLNSRIEQSFKDDELNELKDLIATRFREVKE